MGVTKLESQHSNDWAPQSHKIDRNMSFELSSSVSKLTQSQSRQNHFDLKSSIFSGPKEVKVEYVGQAR